MRIHRAALLALALAAVLLAGRAAAQVPVPTQPGAQPPVVQPPVLQPRPDSTAPGVTVTQTRADSIPATDTLPATDAPPLHTGPPDGFATATTVWDREDLMALRDLTLLELLESIPGVTPLRGGDYGAPEAATALGMAGGRVRIFFDGFEMLPLDGGVPDLALKGLAGVAVVRVQRGPSEIRIDLESVNARDPRALSIFEAGTGDLQTNFFRGTFLHPRVVGGVFGGALDRVDSRGPFRREAGHRTSGWATYGRPLGDAFWLRLEAHMADRDVALSAYRVGFDRRDLVARLRGTLLDGRLTAEAFTGSSLLKTGDDQGVVPIERSRGQHGLRASLVSGPATLGGSLRKLGGPGLPSTSMEGEATLATSFGGAYGRASAESWPDGTTKLLALNAWTIPRSGFSAFGSFGTGERGAAIYPAYIEALPEGSTDSVPEMPEPTSRRTDMTTLRLGGAFERGNLRIEGAWLSVEADSLPPMGNQLDRPGAVAPGGTFQGFEAQGRIGRADGGWSASGWVQRWNKEARYLPRTTFQGSLDFHRVYRETRNLELWMSGGVRGRSEMLVPSYEVPDEGEQAVLARVPSGHSFWFDIQVRVVTVNLFIRWENFTLRQNLQDYPNRVLPYTRAIYGLRWVMWN